MGAVTLEGRIREFLSSGYGFGSGYGSGFGSGFGDGDGSGSGSGDGSGSGSGSGYGFGSGSGYGYGSGSGYGYGSGSGFGDGDGSGSGSGYGSGSGFGDGDGSGNGDGIKSIEGCIVYVIDETPTILRQVRGNVARGAILGCDLSLTPCWVVKQGGTFAHGATLREAMEALRDKLFEDMPEEERVRAFLAETERGKKYPARYFYDWHHRLTGSCDMGRASFARGHGIDVDTYELDLDEFVRLTCNAYGGDVIRRVMEEMGDDKRG